MNVSVALFRSINVGGKNSLPMSQLVTLLEGLGCRNVMTYIQSGNAVFEHRDGDAGRLAKRIGAEVKKCRGFEPSVLLLRPQDVETVIAGNPFPEAELEPKFLHAGFLASPPKSPDLKALDRFRSGSERFRLIGKVLYLHAPDGVGKSKLAANAERLLGVSMTDRNWRTVCKIGELARALR